MSNAAPHHSIYALAYLPDGQRVVTGSGDGTIRIWNAENGEQEGTSMTHGKIVTSLAVTRDGTKIISGDEGGNIKVWGIESHRVVKEWTHPDSCTTLSLSSDDRLVVVAGGLTVGIYTVEGRQVKNSIKVGSEVFSVSFSPDRRKLACGTEDAIWVFEVGSSTLVLGPLQGHKNWISCLRWSLDGRRLFSGSFDQTIRLWDSETGSLVGKTRRGHTDGIISLSLSPDGSKLASASWDRTVRFWNTTSHPPMIPIGQHLQLEDDVTEICFSPSGESVATAGSNGKMYFWRVPSLKTVESRPSSPSSDRSRIVVQSVHESLSQPNESDPSLIGLDNFEPPPDGETSSQVSLSRPEENDQNPIDLPNDDEPHSVRHSAPVSLSRPEENDQSPIDLPNDEEPHSVGHSAPVSLSRPEENDQSPVLTAIRCSSVYILITLFV
ncbi:WD40 repeat-like protein [Imleria badia]|nr:WD40 repeat-like protein [Imleria badia]